MTRRTVRTAPAAAAKPSAAAALWDALTDVAERLFRADHRLAAIERRLASLDGGDGPKEAAAAADRAYAAAFPERRR